MVDRQFADIRASIAQEREHTAAALRGACEQVNAEVEGIFGQTTERFQTAASELRDMSREIYKELEATREALRRGATDLPQETAQQAALMRRAVADQIKALEELSEIVTRSGRAMDVSQPAPLPAERAAAQPTSPPPVQPRRAEPGHVAEPPRSPEPQKPRPAARPPANAKTSERGSGWISDLLARADSEEPAPAPKATAKASQPAQPLDTISLDVARMIDHAAASDAWERHRRGEANAFSRRLYVGRGQQTFDEVRRRYRLDPEFHATLDRYIQEFERLLAELGGDSAGEAVTKTYLLSETGKVYTLLAHAAGRLR
jgi:uncharacterized protein YukE